MNNSQRQQTNNLQNAATAAIAAASGTPFWTAFKITLGIGLAQLVGAMIFLGGFIALVSCAYFLVK